MKKRLRAFICVLCVLALTVTPTFAAWGDDISYGEMRATAQKFTDDTKTQIKSFTLNDTFNYTSLGADPEKTTLSLNANNLQNIVKTNLLPQWSGIAASVFRDQASQLVDLYGEQPIGGNMSQAGFDSYFNMSQGETKYAEETWSCYSLKSKLEQTNPSHSGKTGYDQFTVSGIKRISSLNDARNLMGQALYECQSTTGALSAQEFLDADEAGETRLEGLDSTDSTSGFANVVTAVNCKGSSANFDYVSFGIVFYDFEPVPVAATGLQYVSGPTPTGVITPGSANKSTVTNGSSQDIMHSAVLGDAVTQTTTTTLSGLTSFELSENIGANIGLAATESSSDTSFWADDTFGAGASTSTSSESASMGLNWGTAWKMGGAIGAEQGHSESKEVSKAVETTIALPPHTGTTIEQEASTTTYTQTYQQPAALSYKVAIFAMSGDYYSSSAFGGIGGINASDYDKQSLVIKFDTNETGKPSYGCAATDDLYHRIVNNNQVDSYDTADDRTYTTHSTATDWRKNQEINWSSVTEAASAYYGINVPELSRQNYLYESPGKIEVKDDKTSSHVSSTYPLYDLASVKTPKANYILYDKNTLDLDSITVEGYNRFNVPFYGFTSDWGGWKLCDEKGVVYDDKTLVSESEAGKFVYDSETRTLAPKANAESQSVYIRWVINDGIRQVTGESADPGQDLTELNNVPTNSNPALTPVVRIDIVNTGLDNPQISASGSYTGFYRTPINLNDTMNYVVTNKTGKKIDTQVRWESYELESEGISVNEGTGDVQFTQPGEYHVRPFVVNNDGDQVVPLTSDGDYEWLTVIATEHNLTHYDAKAPTDCTGGDAYGWIEHYRCADCGKYFLDAEGTTEAAEDDVIIQPAGHNWGEWTPSNDPGIEKRVCKNNSNHVEYRNVYTVTFDMNEPDNAPAAAQGQPDAQTFTSDATASVKVPTAPTLTGYTFEGWCTDEEGNNPYDFSEPVSASMTLYAKWTPVKYTIATVAVVNKTAPDADGGTQQMITPATGSCIYFGDPATDERYLDDENYLYFYTEAAYGETVEMTVAPADKFGMSEIWAIPVLAVSDTDASVGEAFIPERQGDTNVYKVTMPASDLAVMGSFAQERVSITYDAGTLSGNPNVGLPSNEEIQYGHAIDGLDGKTPTLSGDLANTTEFAGWFTDAELTKPCLSNTALTADTTLYAKWVDKTNPPTLRTITYTLVYSPTVDIDPDVASYDIEDGTTAYNPTEDVYALADDSTQAQYALLEGDKSCWFKGDGTTTPDFSKAESFDFDTAVSENTYLYAQVVPRTYTVTYYDGDTQLGTQEVEYGGLISQSDADAKAPHKDGQALAGWTTNGALWAFGEDSVTSNLALYANWDYEVTFNANGHGTAPETQVVKYGDKATKPSDPTAEGYEFGGWYTDAACTTPYNFDDPVTEGVTLYAKWTETNPTSVAMHRLYNPNGGEHFYTASDEERDGLVKLGWQYEGTGWTAPVTSNTPVHRLYNPNGGDHHYTMSAEERDWLVSLGWKYEGIGWYSDDAKTVKLYREYNPNAQSGSHNYTTSLEEHKNLVKLGWHDEGTAWYGL
ncbi:InlB B-repeat-containing protein [Denitrobacterium detoxificans]|uniref:InlB B-repeat-containing protein n=1 Tax=Denitrobacterium detoxificans TaxID=79604 RepID=UPI0026EBF39E|nr:InlB B-repeat-containing protein [Denitrobacterium detoxificans]